MAVAKKRNIRCSVGFEKKEMEGYFMIANEDAAKAIINKLTGSQLRLWLYLMMVDSFADLTADGEKIYHSIPSPQEIAIKIGNSPETVEKDIRKLRKLGLYEYRVTAWQGHNLSAASAKEESERLKKKKAETKSQHGGGLNKPQERLNKPQERLNKPQERLNKPQENLETLEKSSNSGSPQTIQTKQIDQTLSDSGREKRNLNLESEYTKFISQLSEKEREKFFNFVKEAIKGFSQPINDLEEWLASKNKLGKNRWEIYYDNFLTLFKPKSQDSKQRVVAKNHREQARKYREEIEQRRKAAHKAWLRKQEASHSPSGGAE